MTDLYLTPEQAAEKWLCPAARVFGEQTVQKMCRGPECAAWRWRTGLAADPDFQSAIQREMAVLAQEAGKEHAVGFHKKAVARVMSNPEGFGIKRERGYCGLGGVPT